MCIGIGGQKQSVEMVYSSDSPNGEMNQQEVEVGERRRNVHLRFFTVLMSFFVLLFSFGCVYALFHTPKPLPAPLSCLCTFFQCTIAVASNQVYALSHQNG